MIQKDLVLQDEHRVHYRRAGAGPPLLLLHALGESSYSWTPVMPALATSHTVLAPDLPGFGDSTPGQDPPTPQHYADVARKFLTALDVGPVTVIGNSFGGTAAIRLAVRNPDAVARLVLVSSAGLGRYVHAALRAMTAPGFGELASALGGTWFGSVQRAWLRVCLLFHNPALAPPDRLFEQQRLARTPHHLATTLAALRAQVSPLGQRELMLPDLRKLTMPTLLIWGAGDRVLPVQHGQAAMTHLPHADFEVLARCGHLPAMERPEQFIAVVDRFLQTAR